MLGNKREVAGLTMTAHTPAFRIDKNAPVEVPFSTARYIKRSARRSKLIRSFVKSITLSLSCALRKFLEAINVL